MRGMFGRMSLAFGALLALIGAAGCPNSEVISSGRSEVRVDGVPTSTVGPDFAVARVRIAQLSVRPTDPIADQALGVEPIGLIQFPQTVDLKSSGSNLLGQVVLGAGQYRGIDLRIQNVSMNVEASDPTSTQCSDGTLTSLRVDPALTVNLTASDLFVVPEQGQIVIELRVDGEKFEQLIQSHCVGNSFSFPSASEFEAAGVFSLGE